jgi:hypothetical protein
MDHFGVRYTPIFPEGEVKARRDEGPSQERSSSASEMNVEERDEDGFLIPAEESTKRGKIALSKADVAAQQYLKAVRSRADKVQQDLAEVIKRLHIFLPADPSNPRRAIVNLVAKDVVKLVQQVVDDLSTPLAIFIEATHNRTLETSAYFLSRGIDDVSQMPANVHILAPTNFTTADTGDAEREPTADTGITAFDQVPTSGGGAAPKAL